MEADSRTRLRRFIEMEHGDLIGMLRVYVARSSLAGDREATSALAEELMNDVTVEALAHAGRFRPDGQPRAWLLGIAANLIKRRQAERATRMRREPLVSEIVHDPGDRLSEDELFDRLAALSEGDPAANLEEDEAINALLDRVTGEDRRVIRLAVLHGLDGQALAAELGVKPGAARVRLHRALERLRAAVGEDVDAEEVGRE